MKRRLLIAGPTASGKTALSLAAARLLDGEIINADSMQLYGGLPIVTACPAPAERACAPHHMFGTIDPARRYSVGEWSEAALALIAAIEARGKTPILIGGTGLYFQALTVGLAPVPEISPDSRARAEALLASEGLDGLRVEAERFDPVSASRIAAADRQRLQRLVEVGYETGRALSSFHQDTHPFLEPGSWTGLVVEPDREALYARIDRRFDNMLNAGALDEVEALMARNLSPDLPAMKALGVPPLMAHLRGEMSLHDAVELAKRDSRRYAKRQTTWFRNQTGDWPRITTLEASVAAASLTSLLDTGTMPGA